MPSFHIQIRLTVITALLSLAVLNVVASVKADLVSVSVRSEISAEVELLMTQINGSTQASDRLFAMAGGDETGVTTGSTTITALEYAWNGSTLSGVSMIEQASTSILSLGSHHQGDSRLYFTFTVDSLTDFVLDGSYGYVNATGSDDTVNWMLLKSDLAYTRFGQAGDSCTTLDEHSFSTDGRLDKGTYTLILTADLSETINEPGTRKAGWTLNEFTLITVVPEPSMFVFLGLMLSALAVSFRRKPDIL